MEKKEEEIEKCWKKEKKIKTWKKILHERKFEQKGLKWRIKGNRLSDKHFQQRTWNKTININFIAFFWCLAQQKHNSAMKAKKKKKNIQEEQKKKKIKNKSYKSRLFIFFSFYIFQYFICCFSFFFFAFCHSLCHPAGEQKVILKTPHIPRS